MVTLKAQCTPGSASVGPIFAWICRKTSEFSKSTFKPVGIAGVEAL